MPAWLSGKLGTFSIRLLWIVSTLIHVRLIFEWLGFFFSELCF